MFSSRQLLLLVPFFLIGGVDAASAQSERRLDNEWTISCLPTSDRAKACSLIGAVYQDSDKSNWVKMSFRQIDGDQIRLIVLTPRREYFGDGIRLAADGRPFAALPIQRCNSAGCSAGGNLSEQQLMLLLEARDIIAEYKVSEGVGSRVSFSLEKFKEGVQEIARLADPAGVGNVSTALRLQAVQGNILSSARAAAAYTFPTGIQVTVASEWGVSYPGIKPSTACANLSEDERVVNLPSASQGDYKKQLASWVSAANDRCSGDSVFVVSSAGADSQSADRISRKEQELRLRSVAELVGSISTKPVLIGAVGGPLLRSRRRFN